MMTIDIFAEPVSAETAATLVRSRRPWAGTLAFLAICAAIAVGVAIFLNRPAVDPDDGTPTPSPTSGLHVLIVAETNTSEMGKLTAEQVAIFSSIPLRNWYDAHCAKEDGFTAYRNFDPDNKLEQENEIWRQLRSRIALPPPSVLMVDGKRSKEIKLPPSPEALQAELEQFAKSKR